MRPTTPTSTTMQSCFNRFILSKFQYTQEKHPPKQNRTEQNRRSPVYITPPVQPAKVSMSQTPTPTLLLEVVLVNRARRGVGCHLDGLQDISREKGEVLQPNRLPARIVPERWPAQRHCVYHCIDHHRRVFLEKLGYPVVGLHHGIVILRPYINRGGVEILQAEVQRSGNQLRTTHKIHNSTAQ